MIAKAPLLTALLLASTAVVCPAYAAAVDPDEVPVPTVEPEPADDPSDLADVIVTARRQSEKAQDVPIALSVLSGESLEASGVYTLEDVQRQVPSFTAFNSNPRNSSVGIRGIGISTASDGLDTSVGFYFDGVYLARPGMALADLIDVESFEVLRGPQGTLFGRNTSAGVVNITTRRPSFTPEITAEASLGNYGYNQLRLSATGPLIEDRLAYRLTVFNTDRDGVLENGTTGIDANSIHRRGFRAQLLATPTPDFSVRLIGEYSDEDDTCCVSVLTSTFAPGVGGAGTTRTLAAFRALGYTPEASTDRSLNNAPQNMRTDQHALSVEAIWNLGWAELTSISAYRYWNFDPLQDSDGTPLDIIQVNVARTKDSQYSQEFRLASNPGRLNWQVGAYLYRNRLDDNYILNQFGTDAGAFYTALARQTNPAAPAVVIAPGSQYIGDTLTHSSSEAVFGQLNYELTDRLTLTVGGRYTRDTRDGVTVTSTRGTPYGPTTIPFNYDVEVEGNNTSYLLSAAYKIAPDSLLYASYSTGYKAAGLNLNAAVTAGSPLIVEPEEVQAFEIGSKNLFFDRRLTLNLAAFRTELTGLQANIAPAGVRSYLANVGDVLSQGVEIDGALRLAGGLTVSGSAAWIDATYTDYRNAPCATGRTAPCDLTGERLFQSPEYNVNLQVRYDWAPVDQARPYAYVQYSWRSEQEGTVQADPLTLIPAYALFNARLGATFEDDRYDLSVWADNLLDEEYFQSSGVASIVGASGYGVSARLGAPRTFGATLRARF